jgi:hypothetical protein
MSLIRKFSRQLHEENAPISRFSARHLLGCKPVGEAKRGPTPKSRCESGVTATSCSFIRSKL